MRPGIEGDQNLGDGSKLVTCAACYETMSILENSVFAISVRNDKLRWLLISLKFVAIALGGLYTWAAVISYSMNEDGINYLDIGDAYMRGDWQTAINPIWSPMYSWILGPVMHFLNPPMQWEFPVVHLVNFAIYLLALVCFDFFWRQVMRCKAISTAGSSGTRYVSLPEWAWWTLGYLLFITSALDLIGVWSVTPDMLMAAFVYLAAALILRIRLGDANWRTFILLGFVLGLAYLTKTVMFPLSIVVLGISLFSVGNVRRAVPRVLVAALVFLLISVPFVAALSMLKGEFTLGDAGTLTYARYLNGVPYPHWQGDPPGNGVPEHPTRRIFEEPPIYEFGEPVGGTYPVAYNPAYWYEGVVVHFDLERQLDYLSFSTLFYLDLFFRQQAGLLVGMLLLYLMSHWRPLPVTEIISKWGLVILALAAFGTYALINVLGRYVAVFVVLFWAGLLINVRLHDSQTSRRLAFLLSIVMILFMLVNIATFNLEGFRDLVGWGNPHQAVVSQAKPPSWPGEVAEELHRLGVQPGDKVAIIGYGFNSFWARLARVKIVAEMLWVEADGFWLGDAALQSEVLQAFASTGAEAIVAENVPSYASLPGWHRVGDSDYYIYIFGS